MLYPSSKLRFYIGRLLMTSNGYITKYYKKNMKEIQKKH